MTTENRDYNVPEPGEENWHVPVNENWHMIDADVQEALEMAQAALDAATSGDSDDEDETSSGDGDSDGDERSTSGDWDAGGTGFSWEQTHVDTSWVLDAAERGNLNVEVVTNLDRDGAGSLADAIESGGSDPTVVVFEVGGVIDNEGETYFRIREPNTWIAGQTAPYPGITMIRGGFRVHEDNVIIQHIGALPGDDIQDPHKARAMTFSDDTSNILADHCTFGWAPDTTVGFQPGGANHGVINSINAEALNESSHPEAPHGYGVNFRGASAGLTYMGNLHSHNWKRNIKPNECEITYINNYIYNWGARVQHGGDIDAEVDWIGNVVAAGNDTDLSSGVFDGDPATVYWEDNLLNPDDTPLEDGDIDYIDSPAHLPSSLSTDDIVPADELMGFLEPTVGARPGDRPSHEQRIIDDWLSGDGRIIDHQNDVGGYPDYSPSTRELDVPSSGLLDWIDSFTAEVEGTG